MHARKAMMTVAAFALAIGTAQAADNATNPITMQEGVDFHGLQPSGWHWSRHDLVPDVCSARITFTNTGNVALGNIHYRTYYVSETGVVHESSIIDAVIEKLIQPGQTREIELESVVIPLDSIDAGIVIKSCDELPQFTKREGKETDDKPWTPDRVEKSGIFKQ